MPAQSRLYSPKYASEPALFRRTVHVTRTVGRVSLRKPRMRQNNFLCKIRNLSWTLADSLSAQACKGWHEHASLTHYNKVWPHNHCMPQSGHHGTRRPRSAVSNLSHQGGPLSIRFFLPKTVTTLLTMASACYLHSAGTKTLRRLPSDRFGRPSIITL